MINIVRAAGVGPALTAWKAAVIPLDHARIMDVATISKLDDFLRLSERQPLKNAGSISSETAAQKAEEEFEKYTKDRGKNYISDFDRAVKALEQKNEKPGKKRGRSK